MRTPKRGYPQGSSPGASPYRGNSDDFISKTSPATDWLVSLRFLWMNVQMESREQEAKPAADPPPHRTGPLPPPSVPPMRGSRSDRARDPVISIPPPEVSPFDPLAHSAPVGFSPEKAVNDQLAALETWAQG